MKRIFVINGGQVFGHSGGRFNQTIAENTVRFFEQNEGFEIRLTDINQPYDAKQEV